MSDLTTIQISREDLQLLQQAKDLKSTKRGVNVRGYIRVSTDIQVEKGYSLQSQESEITAVVKNHRWNLTKLYTDAGITGTGMVRDQFDLLLEEAQPGEYIMAYSISRIGRNVRDSILRMNEAKDRGIFIYIIDCRIDSRTPAGELMYNIMASLADHAVKESNRNISVVMNNMSASNVLRGKPHFGYQFVAKDLPFEPHEGEQRCIDVVAHLLTTEQGRWTNSMLARFLNAEDPYTGSPNPEYIEYYKETQNNRKDKRDERIKNGKPEWKKFTCNTIRTLLVGLNIRHPERCLLPKLGIRITQRRKDTELAIPILELQPRKRGPRKAKQVDSPALPDFLPVQGSALPILPPIGLHVHFPSELKEDDKKETEYAIVLKENKEKDEAHDL